MIYENNNPEACKDNISVALLIPAFNSQKDLELTIATLPVELPLFVLIVDDGSLIPISIIGIETPHKLEVLRKDNNTGIEDSLRLGIDYLSSKKFEYIARIDCGDIAINSRFIKQYDYMKNNPEIGLLGSYATGIDSESRQPICTFRPPVSDTEIRKKIFFLACSVHPSWMIRSAVIRNIGNYSTDFQAAEDLDFFVRVMKSYKVENLPESLVQIDLNPQGISSQKRKKQIFSTIRIQLKNINLFSFYYCLGFLKNIFHLFFSYKSLLFIKKIILKRNYS